MSTDPKRPAAFALPFLERAASALSRGFQDLVPCGSFRRGDSMVGDVDLVISGGLREDVPRLLAEAFDRAERSPTELPGRPRACHRCWIGEDSMLVDAWVVGPESVGSAMLHATGSKIFNIIVRRWARQNGLFVNSEGVYRGSRRGEKLAGATERECLAALSLPWFAPRDRHDGSLEPWLKEMNEGT